MILKIAGTIDQALYVCGKHDKTGIRNESGASFTESSKIDYKYLP